ncbi:MAG: nitrous oxide reductase family maturation protein NosD [Saprospiraceae bacterium]|nr:nitrous oxide reductase family maturation protein NosD [Saprospiraceae bacterium]
MRFAITIFTILLLLPLYFSARTWQVGEGGDFASIRQAITEVEPGDTLMIQSGHYREGNIVVDKPLALIGIDFPILDGENESEVLTIRAHNVLVQGLQIQDVPTSYLNDLAGIRVERKRNFVIRGNRLVNTFFGIYLEYAHHGIVEGNEILGEAVQEMSSGNGIHAWYCRDLQILNNEVLRHRDGIYFEFVDSSHIRGNRSEANIRYGLHFMFSNDDTYTDNVFRNNGAGVAVMFSKNIDMLDNLFEQNWGRASYGLLLKEIYDAVIRGNRFVKNTIAINVEGSTRIDYLENDFRQNGWAIKMAGGCLTNDFTRNNFIANTMDMVLNSRVNDNTFDGNYWSEYTGYDLDRDGIGDVPHKPVKLFSYLVDRHPETIVLLRSLFVDLINFSEKISPVLTPANVQDHQPKMHPIP